MELDFNAAAENPTISASNDSDGAELEGSPDGPTTDASFPDPDAPDSAATAAATTAPSVSTPDQAPPSKMTPFQTLRSKIPFSQKSAEFTQREQMGHNRLITPSSTPVSNDDSPSKFNKTQGRSSVNLKEAMAR